jgi:6-pyruvoyltetrahydropterin/6-carboxytetrahydropterin synthase
MAATYTLKVVVDFAASHILHGHSGKCARLHGHNWKVEAEVQTHDLDHLGVAIDFQDIKTPLRELVEALDHRHLNDLPAFQGVNPTAEHVARYLFRELASRLDDGRVRVNAITIWETERASVRYTEDAR